MARRSAALRHFKRADPYFYQATQTHHAVLPTELREKRTRRQLFVSLVSIVISQQLGVAAADTIFMRVKKACKGQLTSLSILTASPEAFRKAGLSGSKTKTLKAIAEAVEEGLLDLLALKKVPEADAVQKLVSIWGLGPWSAEMFLISGLAREDVFSIGDLGLVRAMETMYNLPKNSPRETLLTIAQKWSPYRTYACLLLWRTRDTKAGSSTP